MTTLLQLVILSLTARMIISRLDGAPSESCSFMVPGHVPNKRQVLSSTPYEVKAEILGKDVRISIKGTQIIKGFQIQAREKSDVKLENVPATGSFKLMSNATAKYQNCTGHKFPKFSSITHTSPSRKENLTFLWSPTNRKQNINVTFYATLVYDFKTFWVMQPSNEINILDMSDSDTPGGASSSTSTLSILVVTFLINLLLH